MDRNTILHALEHALTIIELEPGRIEWSQMKAAVDRLID